MKTKQYTIRNIPPAVDRYLRKRAQISGQSLNQVIIDELSSNAGLRSGGMTESLDWFIGGGTMGDDERRALDEADKQQKELTREQWRQRDY